MHISPLIMICTVSVLVGPGFGQQDIRFGRFDRQVDGQTGIVGLELDQNNRPVRLTRDGDLLVEEGRLPLALSTLASPIRSVDIGDAGWLVGTDDGVGLARDSDSKTWYLKEPGVRSVSHRNGCAAALTRDGTVLALDSGSGTPRWRRDRAFPGARAVEVMPDGGVWIADTDRHRLVRTRGLY